MADKKRIYLCLAHMSVNRENRSSNRRQPSL